MPPVSPVPEMTAAEPSIFVPAAGDVMTGLAGASLSTTMSREPEREDDAPPPRSLRDWVARTTYPPEATAKAHDQYPAEVTTEEHEPFVPVSSLVVTVAPGKPCPESRPLVT